MSTRFLHGITSSAVSKPVFQTLVLPPPSTTQIHMSMLQTLLGSVPPHKNHSSDTGTITANKLDPAPKETPPIMTYPIGERKNLKNSNDPPRASKVPATMDMDINMA